jgi:hypothetical protein
VYEKIRQLRPFFYSIREFKEIMTLDLKIPVTWVHEGITEKFEMVTPKIQDKNENFTLLSICVPSTKEGYSVAFNCGQEIIKYNTEEEEKMRLFKEKLEELKILFTNSSLDKLKDLSFIKNENEDGAGLRMVRETEDEGSVGDRLPQGEDD